MRKKGFRSLMIPGTLYERLKQHVEDSKGRYVSISEIARQAIWEHLQKAS
jgi:Arc/MetJ-type ribon-helix-helix transcriptional regulator